jgi:all-trans-retinol 13,14-reductase
LDLYNLRIPDSAISLNPYFSANLTDYLASITDNRLLQNVLAGLNFLYAGDKETTSLYLHATVIHSFISSAWRPVDGSSQIADFLADDICSFGGTILKDSEVRKLHVDEGIITSAELSNGETLQARQFISNMHPSLTLDLIDSNKIKKPYRKRIQNLANTTSSFTVFVCLHENEYPYENFNHYCINSDTVWKTQENRHEPWPQGYMFLTPATSEAENYATCAIIMTFMDFKEVEPWQNTGINNRGADYRRFKQQKAEQLLDAVEKDRPGFRSKIKKTYTSSPLTYRDYTGTKEGSIYGIALDCNDPIKTYIPARTKIPNLFFTGQNIGMHGVLGVTVGAVQTCAEFLGLDYLIKQVRAAS